MVRCISAFLLGLLLAANPVAHGADGKPVSLPVFQKLILADKYY